MLDRKALRVELARRSVAQWRVAESLQLPPSTFSDYVRGARPAPADFGARVEQVLGLEPGTLSTATATQK